MGDQQVHLVTGATGFIGGALVTELLRRTGDRVVMLVRPSVEGAGSAEARGIGAIAHAIAIYGAEVVPEELRERCRVVVGDIGAPGCGVEDAGAIGAVEQVWHCAASLRYEDRHRAEIEATNVGGTGHVLELARRVGATTFNDMSTAYVAGRRSGTIAECLVDAVECNNHYERSKVAAEKLVSGTAGMRWRILRPSVVVGHSRSFAGATTAGFYGFLRQLVQFRGMIERTQQGLLGRCPLALRVDPQAAIDLVPVDQVAEEAVRIGLSDMAGVFHLTHPAPPRLGLVLDTMFELVGMPPPRYVERAAELDWLGSRFDDRLDFYGSYLRSDKCFERVRTAAAIGPEPVAGLHFDAGAVAALGRPYLAALQAGRRNLPVAR